MNRSLFASVFLLALPASASASPPDAGTPGCNGTDPNCYSVDPCTYDTPIPGYECGAQSNNATTNGTFITQAAGLGFTWDIPKGWSADALTEPYFDCGVNYDASNYPAGCTPTISFGTVRPREFLEQMPGFGASGATDPHHDQFFSYNFAWWLEGRADVTARDLSRDFLAYYQGLMSWCYESPGVKIPGCTLSEFKSRFVELGESWDGAKVFTGEVQLFDAWYTSAPMTLNFVATTRYCEKAKHQVVLFSTSSEPRPWDHGATRTSNAVWEQLLERQAALACE